MSNANIIGKSRENQYRITQQPEGTGDDMDPYVSKAVNTPTSPTAQRRDPSTTSCMDGFCDNLATACCCACLFNCNSDPGCCDGCGDCGGCDGCGDCGGCDGCGDCGGCVC